MYVYIYSCIEYKKMNIYIQLNTYLDIAMISATRPGVDGDH